jgi:hypothetical protein
MATKGGPNVVEDGLVLYLDAANPLSYPGTGTVWKDLSSSGFDATLINSPTYNGTTFSFDGTNQFVTVDSGLKTVIENASESSVTVLANIKEIEHVDNLIGWGNANISNGVSRTWGIYAQHTALKSSYLGTIIGNTSNLVNKWYFLTAQFDSSTTYGTTYGIRYDGILNQTTLNLSSNASWKLIPTGNNITIAKTSYFSRYMQTDISEIKVYNRKLSQEEILQNYNATKGRYGL